MTCIAMRVAPSGHVSQFAIPSTVAIPTYAAALDLCFDLPLTHLPIRQVARSPLRRDWHLL